MKNRKFLLVSSYFIVLLFGLLLAGCDSAVESETTDTPKPKTYNYTITFNANDGSENPTTTTQAFSYTSPNYSAYVTLNANTFTRSGYTFLGWSERADSKTAYYEDQAKVSLSYDTTLYAVWKNDTFAYSYTITFDGNGGTTSSGATKMTQMAEGNTSTIKVTLNSNPFSRDGYVFVGWSPYSASVTPSYEDGASYSVYSNTTLYAVWVNQADMVTLTLEANDGSGNKKNVSTVSGQTVYLNTYANTFTRDYFTLTAFNEKADGSGTSYSIDSYSYKSIKVNGNTTLYAEWKENPCIIFDGNGGKTSDDSTEIKQYQEGQYEYQVLFWGFTPKNVDSSSESETVRLSANQFTRDGYSFKGWSTYNFSSSPMYTDKQSIEAFTKTSVLGITVWSGKTLYAVWEKNPTLPAITYNMNGGSNLATFTENSNKITNTIPSAKYDYYLFDGWATSQTATIPKYYKGDSYTSSNNITLYAVWSLDTIFDKKSVSVPKREETIVGTFTLIKSEKLKFTVSDVDGALTYYIKNSSGTTIYESEKISKDENGEFTATTISAGTYTLVAGNENIMSTHTAKITLEGN